MTNNNTVCLLPVPTTRNSGEGEWVRESARYKLGDIIQSASVAGIYGPCSGCRQDRLLVRGTGTPSGFTGLCALCAAMVDAQAARDTVQGRRIAELETGLRQVQAALRHADYCHADTGTGCTCNIDEAAALLTSLLELR